MTDYKLHLCWELFGALAEDIFRRHEQVRLKRIADGKQPFDFDGDTDYLIHQVRNYCARLGREEPKEKNDGDKNHP